MRTTDAVITTNFALNEPSAVTHCSHVEILLGLVSHSSVSFHSVHHDQISLDLKNIRILYHLINIPFETNIEKWILLIMKNQRSSPCKSLLWTANRLKVNFLSFINRKVGSLLEDRRKCMFVYESNNTIHRLIRFVLHLVLFPEVYSQLFILISHVAMRVKFYTSNGYICFVD